MTTPRTEQTTKEDTPSSPRVSLAASILKAVRIFSVLLLFAASGAIALYVYQESRLSDDLPAHAPIPAASSLQTAEKTIDAKEWSDTFLKKHEDKIEQCESEDVQAMEVAADSLESWFNSQEAGIDPLLDEMFSFSNKARLAYYYARDYVMEDDRGRELLREITEKHLGSSAELKAAIEKNTGTLKLEVNGHHNVLMLSLEKAMLREMPKLSLSKDRINTIALSYSEYFSRALESDLDIVIGSTLAAETLALGFDLLVSRPVAQALCTAFVSVAKYFGISMGAEAATLSGGAMLAPWTLGTSVVISIVAAVAIDYFAEEHARKEVRAKLMDALRTNRNTTLEAYRGAGRQGIAELHAVRRDALHTALVTSIEETLSEN